MEDDHFQNILHFILSKEWEDKTMVRSIVTQALQEIIVVSIILKFYVCIIK